MSCLDLKGTPKHRSSIPLPHCTVVRGYGNFHDISRGLETFWVVGEYLCWTPPKTSIFGHLRVKADQLSHGEGYGRAIDLFEGEGHITNMESHVLLKVKVGHLTTLAPDTVSSILISTLHEATTNLHQPSSGISKFIQNVKRKCAGNQEKWCLHWAQVRKFYLIVKIGYYP